MSYQANTISSFWHGPLSKLELLTLESFIENGHEFDLYMYEAPNIKINKKVNLKDANEIVPRNKLFTYKGYGDCRVGSLGGFSDIFRYYLIYKKGGWYVDMDVTCLNSFNDISAPYVFKKHKTCGTVANVLKCPKECDFLKDLIVETEQRVTELNSHWALPLEILNNHVKDKELTNYITEKNLFGDDDPEEIKALKFGNYFLIKDCLPSNAIHWCKESSYGTWDLSMRYMNAWGDPIPLTLYYNLLEKFGLIYSDTRKPVSF
jgi:hypothetical protein